MTRDYKQILIIWLLALTAIAIFCVQFYVYTTPKVHADSFTSDKCSTNCNDPTRPSFDGWGNEFDYLGNLIKASCPNVADPISGANNPECVCNAPSYLVGFSKDTNQAVCNTTTGCPWADAVPLGVECDKLAPQANNQQTSVDNPVTTPSQSAVSLQPFQGK